MPDTDPVENPNIYRAIKKKRWYVPTERKVLSAAFLLKEGEVGLSVLKRVGCAQGDDGCIAHLRECYGEFVLETQNVLDLDLRLVDDDPAGPEFSDNHAEIHGLPPYDTPKEAEDAATPLALMATLHYDRDGRY
jgi:hypothetical protein